MPITILNGSTLRDDDLRETGRALREIFATEVTIRRASLKIRDAYDGSRHQTNSTALLAQILAGGLRPSEKQIAVVDVDLFIPILTFVFGEAQLLGSAAIVSTHRLSNQSYGLAPDSGLLLRRLQKEIVHELGHTFGLYHCRYFECVMRSSTYVEEIDMKLSTPCANCSAMLARSDAEVPVPAIPG